jgi:hypothetical protein
LTQLEPYRAYFGQRWAQGWHNASQLYQALIRLGDPCGVSQVRAAVPPGRAVQGLPPSRPPSLHPAMARERRWGLLDGTSGSSVMLAPFLMSAQRANTSAVESSNRSTQTTSGWLSMPNVARILSGNLRAGWRAQAYIEANEGDHDKGAMVDHPVCLL